MSSDAMASDQQPLTHVIYDSASGRVIGRFRSRDIVRNEYREREPSEVLSLFSADERVISRLPEGDAGNLAVLATSLSRATDVQTMRVSVKRQTLVSKPKLRMRTEREVLEGDGQDSVSIDLDVVDEQGRVIRDYEGTIHFVTSRGKLSAKGGDVAIERGQGNVTLTSVRETVDKVTVSARTDDGSLISDELTFSFQ
jgi:hypothetical protein